MTEKQNSPKQFFEDQVQHYSRQLSQIQKNIRLEIWKNLKHLFIDPAVCVGNPVDIAGWSQHGRESTYLRTAGINYVFAMIGAPVLADCFIFSPVQLFTRFKITLDLIQVIPIQQIPRKNSGKINYASFGF